MEVENATFYRLLSIETGQAVQGKPALTIALTDNEARVRTTLGETVTVARVDFIRLARWILRENDGVREEPAGGESNPPIENRTSDTEQ